jgi:Tol biopolymer transport system component
MSLAAGGRIGPYEVVALLGVGGMGEVYRARDARLGRDVAIKVLPPAFTSDADRLARFEREARMLASLNHPHIAALYGLEEQDGQRALVLELVEGETLADRLRARGRLPLQEALAFARQIADALDAAHDRGIVHRDLKPANVKITPDGIVKVLDFGLAKAASGSGPLTGGSEATLADTREGVIVGTAAYMSPEQARGQAVDKRTDIWAFGCVLFEMLAGRAAFHGETMSDTIARILGATPEWTALPPETPRGVRRLLERCLERDLKRRLRDLGDLELAIAVDTPLHEITPSAWTRWAGGAVMGALIAAAVMVGLDRWRPRGGSEAAPRPVRFDVPITQRTPESNAFSVSPDGDRIVFLASGVDGVLRMWMRSLDSAEVRPVSGTEGEVAFNTSLPFWSPDGRFIGFYADGRIKRIDSQGGVVETVCQVPGVAVGGTWGPRDIIVVGNTGGGLVKCPAAGGTASPVTQVDPRPGLAHFFPVFLPDGRRLIYLRIARANPAEGGVYLADLDRPPDQQPTDRLLATGFATGFVSATDREGHLLFVRDQTLWSVPFDVDRAVVIGDPVQRAGRVGSFRDGAFFGASRTLLATRGQLPDTQLVWHDRQGKRLGTVGEPGPYVGVSLSPDATRAVVLREIRLNRADQDLWVIDLARGATTRLTAEPLLESMPAWTVDGAALVFAVGHGDSDVIAQRLDGSPARTIVSGADFAPRRINPFLTTLSTTPDGRSFVVTAEGDGNNRSDLWLLSLTSRERVPLLQQELDQTQGVVSPDGRWLAYVSNESGPTEVFLRRVTLDVQKPSLGPATLVSRGGGRAPRWRADSRELFYQSPGGGLFVASIETDGPGPPRELFRAPGMLPHWGVTADGQRFLLGVPATQETSPPFHVVLNWMNAPSR